MPLNYQEDGMPHAAHPINKGRNVPLHASDDAQPTMSLTRATGDWFGVKASTYNNGREGDGKWELELEGVAHLLRNAQPKERLIDIACGTGRFFPIYANLGLEPVGVDVSAEMLAQAQASYPSVPLIEMDLRKLGENPPASDHVVCMRLIEKMTENEACQAVGLMAHIAEKSVVFGCLTGPHVEHRNRSNVHRLAALEESLAKEGFRIEEQFQVRDPDYYIWKAGRA